MKVVVFFIFIISMRSRAESLPEFSVTETDIKKYLGNCQLDLTEQTVDLENLNLLSKTSATELLYKNNEYRHFFNDQLNKNKYLVTLAGVTLTNITPVEMETLLYLTPPNNVLVYSPSNWPERNDIATICDTISCAMKHIFGKTRGRYILYAFLKYGLNLSSNVSINSDPNGLSLTSIKSILTAASLLPDFLQKKALYGKSFYQYLHNHFPNYIEQNKRVISNAAGAVFDPIYNYNFYQQTIIFFHELSHRLDKKYNFINLPHTRQWVEYTKLEQPLSFNARFNSDEDFAEALSLYRINPTKLKSRSPLKYDFIKKNVFHNKEYLDSICL